MNPSFSQLEIARYCGMAPKLSKQHGAGRSAALSKARHAQMAGQLESSGLLASLDDDELEQIREWREPDPVEFMGQSLTYAAATKEERVGLLPSMEACGYLDEKRLTRGIIDMSWLAGDVAVVADAKRTEYTSSPDDLQLIAGGFAKASRWGCGYFATGIWALETGRWMWGPTVDLYSMEAASWADKLTRAATNQDGFSTGAHCSRCWARRHCPEYLLPPELALTSLQPFTTTGLKEGQSAASVRHALELATRAKETAQIVIDEAKAYVAREGSLPSRDGRLVYRQTRMPGRKSVSLNVLREELGDGAERFIKQGNSYSQYRWVKA